jgi:hypothetical protein
MRNNAKTAPNLYNAKKRETIQKKGRTTPIDAYNEAKRHQTTRIHKLASLLAGLAI